MKALVTGGAGQLGRALAAVCPQGSSVVALDHRALDASDSSAVTMLLDRERPDAILNAAAYTAVDLAERERADAWLVNAEAPRILAREAAARGIRLVHVSTDFVFDGRQSSPYRPDDTPTPPERTANRSWPASRLRWAPIRGRSSRGHRGSTLRRERTFSSPCCG